MNETDVSSTSTDWSMQSISIKLDLPIFIDWLLRALIEAVLSLEKEKPGFKY